MDDFQLPLGSRLYRIFLLAILFGVLWAKGYLWTVFILALLLYLFDTIVKTILAIEAARLARSHSSPQPESEPEPEPGPPPRRGGGRTRWKWSPEDKP